MSDDVARSAERKAYLNVVLPLFVVSVIAYVDRVNIGYAALTMNADLGFDPRVFGLGAGIFFAGYFLFEIPGALVAERYSPRLWLARIMISWGIVSGPMAFMRTPAQFYALRFLLGVAEASLYPVIYASCIPRFFGEPGRARGSRCCCPRCRSPASSAPRSPAGSPAFASPGSRAGRCCSWSRRCLPCCSAWCCHSGWPTGRATRAGSTPPRRSS